MDIGGKIRTCLIEDLIEVFKMYKVFPKMDIGELFAKDSDVKYTRGHIVKLEKLGCRLRV